MIIMNNNQVFGLKGETLACKKLKKMGYKIIERNYKCKLGELDIIAMHKGVLVFVEVKSRTSLLFGRPCLAVDEYKQQKLIKLAQYYINTTEQYNILCRFDVVEVLDDSVNVIQNAFTM